ncbi:hypothetical protein CY652_03340 [Burkholderia sp. WAC0059]|nr:hypothetical protein CY652_03340 [Burkholderia sp. WAC0059]
MAAMRAKHSKARAEALEAKAEAPQFSPEAANGVKALISLGNLPVADEASQRAEAQRRIGALDAPPATQDARNELRAALDDAVQRDGDAVINSQTYRLYSEALHPSSNRERPSFNPGSDGVVSMADLLMAQEMLERNPMTMDMNSLNEMMHSILDQMANDIRRAARGD